MKSEKEIVDEILILLEKQNDLKLERDKTFIDLENKFLRSMLKNVSTEIYKINWVLDFKFNFKTKSLDK